jgi:AcrR family transcriptional regulator
MLSSWNIPMSQNEADQVTKRIPLDRKRIVSEARDLVCCEGLDALSMRRLAERLGCGAMSLYRHIEDRQALVIALLDDVAGGIDVPQQSDPHNEIEAILLIIHHEFCREPWILRALIFEGLESLDILPLVDRIFAALFALGFTAREASLIYLVLIQHVYGAALQATQTRDPARMERLRKAVETNGYEHVARAFMEAPGTSEDSYREQLRIILRGLLPVEELNP